jgi:hypothetical protein
MERDTTILEAGTGDSPNPWSDDDNDDDIAYLTNLCVALLHQHIYTKITRKLQIKSNDDNGIETFTSPFVCVCVCVCMCI